MLFRSNGDINIKQNTIINHSESIALGIKKTDEFEQSNILQTLLSGILALK